MSYEYSLVAEFPGENPEADAVRRAAEALGLAPESVGTHDPRFFHDGLSVFAVESDDGERELTRLHFGFANNMSLVFSDNSRSDHDMNIRVMQNILKVSLSFAADQDFKGVLIAEYSDDAYLASIADGAMTLNRRFWDAWDASPEVLAVVPEPHRIHDLWLTR